MYANYFLIKLGKLYLVYIYVSCMNCFLNGQLFFIFKLHFHSFPLLFFVNEVLIFGQILQLESISSALGDISVFMADTKDSKFFSLAQWRVDIGVGLWPDGWSSQNMETVLPLQAKKAKQIFKLIRISIVRIGGYCGELESVPYLHPFK